MSCGRRIDENIAQYRKATMYGFDKEMLLSSFQGTEVNTKGQGSCDLLVSDGGQVCHTSKDRL